MAKRRKRVYGGDLTRDRWFIERYAQTRACPNCDRQVSVYQASGTDAADLRAQRHPPCTCPGCGATLTPVMRAVAGWFWHMVRAPEDKGLTPEAETCSIGAA